MLHRSLTATYRSADGGRGCIITDKDGKAYLDASGGAAVSCLGHGHPRINAAIKRQVEKLAFAHTSFFTNDPAEELAVASVGERAGRTVERLFHLGRLGSDGGGAEADPPDAGRARRGAARPLLRAALLLPREHARGSGGFRQHGAAQALRAHPANERHPCRGVPCRIATRRRGRARRTMASGRRGRSRMRRPRTRVASPSSPKPSPARRSAPCRRHRATFARSDASATRKACSSSSTR